DALSERDARIAEEIASWTATVRGGASLRGGAGRSAATYPVRAFVALVGHPHVASADDPDVPIEVKRIDLGFNALPAGERIVLQPSLDGERLPPPLLETLLHDYAPGEPLILVEPDRRRCLLVDAGDEARAMWSVLQKHGHAFPPESHGPL